MDAIPFTQLVTSLPRGDSLRAASCPIGFRYVEQPNRRFVEPDLEVLKPLHEGSTSVVLLAAPGAVGKSTVAAELAARSGAALWDLSKLQVGSRTFSGTILEAYGSQATGVLKRLREGSFLFVLDALDEAQVRAGSKNFDEFIEELAAAYRSPRPLPSLVLLARTDTADWVHLVLEDENVPLARFQIAYFDEPRALTFIEKRLDQRASDLKKSAIHRQQTGPFREARSALFGLVYRLFGVDSARAWEDERVRNFLGYAPVLEALTDYLDVGNYMALLQELQADEGTLSDPWEFLSDVVTRLLEREQGKVTDAVRPHLEPLARTAAWEDWDLLYQPAEQNARVLGRALNHPVDAVGDRLVPGLRSAYETALLTILPQHPFLAGKNFANVVFKEYIFSWGLAKADSQTTDALRLEMASRESPFLPSQLFGRFMRAFSPGDEIVLDGRDFGVLYESLSSLSGSAERQVSLTVLQNGRESIQAIVTPITEGDEEIAVELLDTGQGLHFWRRLTNADVDVEVQIRLGLEGQRFALGPSVQLSCGNCETLCEHLEVDAAGGVRIEAASYSALFPTLRITVRNQDRGALAVHWPNVAYPWAEFRTQRAIAPAVLAETLRGDVLRKLILMFRRQRTRKRSTVGAARWSPEQLPARVELVELALSRGVLRQVKGVDALEFSNDYASLKSLVEAEPDLSASALEFLEEYLGVEQAARILARR